MEKIYYGIPCTKFYEELIFVNLDGMKIFNSNIKITLHIIHSNGITWHCEKSFPVVIDLKKVLSQTYYMEKSEHKMMEIGNYETVMSDFVDKNSLFFVKEIWLNIKQEMIEWSKTE